MTATEMAENIFNEMYGITPTRFDEKQIAEDREIARMSAIIATRRIIEQFSGIYKALVSGGIFDGEVEDSENYKYWMDVKSELEKMKK